jgi:2-dehydropantoate 2-reductase
VAVVGTGAIGGYYGARLAHAGHRVRFVARSGADALREHGLTVDSWLGDFSVRRPDVRGDVADLPPSDLVLVATKATGNDDVFPSLGPALKPGAALVCLQNGFGAEERLAALHPRAHVFGGLCFICSYRTDEPWVIEHTAYGRLSLAALDPVGAARELDRLAAVFRGAGVDTEVLGGVLEARLRKLVWNIPFNGLSVILGATTGDLAASPAARRAVESLMSEVIEAAAAGGVVIEPEFAVSMMGTTDSMDAYNPSMRLDHLAGRPMEIEAIYWNVIRWAESLGCEMPRAALLAWQLEHVQSLV